MIYLASQSPARAMLLNNAGIAFEVVNSLGDEETVQHPVPQAMALERARVNAHGAADCIDQWQMGDVILAADTVTSLGSEIYGKPSDDKDAIRILSSLQGTTHTVTTAQCCYIPSRDEEEEKEAIAISMAQVTMLPMSLEQIEAYLGTGEHKNRSGAYAIQESGDQYIAEFKGSKDTITGLHVESVIRLYEEVTNQVLVQKGTE